MNDLVTVEKQSRRSVTHELAHRYGMEADTFEAALRATVFPKEAAREQFAAFLLVAREYKLNPITKEIYAFPAKGGGIVPVVSIDGWMNLVNSHPAFDGMEFHEEHSEEGKLISTTCVIYRKDRSHPISVTEYLEECRRSTDPWKMQHRMLRHKAAIQCARYAFGFAGIYDEDEALVLASSAVGTGGGAPRPPVPPPRSSAQSSATIDASFVETEKANPQISQDDHQQASEDQPQEDRQPDPPKPPTPSRPAPTKAVAPQELSPEDVRKRFVAAAKAATSHDALVDAWDTIVGPIEDSLFPPDHEDLVGIFRKREHDFE